MTSNHAMNRMIARCDPAFGVAPYDAMRKAEAMRDAITDQYPRLDAYMLVIAKSHQRVKVGKANGDMLCVLVRNNDIVTVMLRRSTQKPLEGMKHFHLQ